jgi:hypothetical protein
LYLCTPVHLLLVLSDLTCQLGHVRGLPKPNQASARCTRAHTRCCAVSVACLGAPDWGFSRPFIARQSRPFPDGEASQDRANNFRCFFLYRPPGSWPCFCFSLARRNTQGDQASLTSFVLPVGSQTETLWGDRSETPRIRTWPACALPIDQRPSLIERDIKSTTETDRQRDRERQRERERQGNRVNVDGEKVDQKLDIIRRVWISEKPRRVGLGVQVFQERPRGGIRQHGEQQFGLYGADEGSAVQGEGPLRRG